MRTNLILELLKLFLLAMLAVIKAYKLHNFIDGSFFISRDVVFHEQIFPFKEGVDLEHLVLSFPVTDSNSQTFIHASLVVNQNDPPPRRFTRTKHLPTWMQDYISSVYTHYSPLSFYLSYTISTYNVSKVPESCTYTHASRNAC